MPLISKTEIVEIGIAYSEWAAESDEENTALSCAVATIQSRLTALGSRQHKTIPVPGFINDFAIEEPTDIDDTVGHIRAAITCFRAVSMPEIATLLSPFAK